MTHIGDRSSAIFEPADVIIRLWTLDRKHQYLQLSRRALSKRKEWLADWAPDAPAAQTHGIFDGDDLAIMRVAYLKACIILGPNLKPTQKEEIALSILSSARRGVCDPHQLALKAIATAQLYRLSLVVGNYSPVPVTMSGFRA